MQISDLFCTEPGAAASRSESKFAEVDQVRRLLRAESPMKRAHQRFDDVLRNQATARGVGGHQKLARLAIGPRASALTAAPTHREGEWTDVMRSEPPVAVPQ